LQYTVQI